MRHRARRAIGCGAVLLLAFGLPSPGNGQGTPREQSISTRIMVLPQGWTRILITNNSAVPITAYVVWSTVTPPGKRRNGWGVRYMDSVINRNVQMPVMPGETRAENIGGAGRDGTWSWSTVQLRGALFADGSSFGDAIWVQRLVRNRRILHDSVERAIALLEAAQKSGMSRDEVLGQLEDCRSEARAAGVGVDEKALGGKPFAELSASLRTSLNEDGTPVTPDKWVPQMLKGLRQRRQALLASKPSIVEEGAD